MAGDACPHAAMGILEARHGPSQAVYCVLNEHVNALGAQSDYYPLTVFYRHWIATYKIGRVRKAGQQEGASSVGGFA